MSVTGRVFAGIGAAILGCLLIVGLWFGYWAIAEQGQTNRYIVNTRSQQYQAATVAQLRDKVVAYQVAVDEGQKVQIKLTFCQLYVTLDPAPADLVAANSVICY
jgi:hypothetical protein